jgi:hypothetical protein
MNVFTRCAPDLVKSTEGYRVVKKYNRVGETLTRYELHHHECLHLSSY